MIDARFEKRRIAARTTILSLNPSGFNLSQGSLFLNFKNYGINSLIIIFFILYLVDSLKIKNCKKRILSISYRIALINIIKSIVKKIVSKIDAQLQV